MASTAVRNVLLGGTAMLAASAIAALVAPSPARADSACSWVFGFAPPNVTFTDNCTSANGNGTVFATSTIGLSSYSGLGYVVDLDSSPQTATVTGYIESTTASTGTMRVATDQALSFIGAGSTLVSSGGNATVLKIIAPSATITTGTLTATGGTSVGLDATATTGALTVGTGTTSVTGGADNIGVKTNTTAGTNTTTTGTTTVDGDNAIGVLANATGNNLVLTTGTTTASGFKAAGVTGSNTTGLISGSSSSTIVTGDSTVGVNLAATGGSIVYNTGTVSVTGSTTTATGVYAGSSGVGGTNLTTGLTTVASTGSSIGVEALTNTGPLVLNGGTTIATGPNAFGLYTVATDGSSLVNTGYVLANGAGSTAVSASTVQSSGTCGTNTVNVTGAVNGTVYGVNANGCGASTVNVTAGNYVATTVGTATILNTAGTVATTTVNGNVSSGGVSGLAIDNNGTSSVTTVGAGATLTGLFDGTAGTDTVTLASNATWFIGGTNDFQAGADTLTNGGLIIMAGSTTLAGLETFANLSAGRVYLPAGTLSLPASTSFTNSGTLIMGGTSSTLTSLAPVINSGTISLRNINTTTDVLTITNNYVGAGGTLAIDASDTTADKLVIGGAASGTTSVNAFLAGTGLLNTAGILVVDTGTSTAGAFTLGTVSGTTSPLVDYGLVQVGADYYLTAAPNPSAFDPAAISTLGSSIWYQSADEVIAETDQPAATVGLSFWGHGYYSQDKFGDNDDSVVIGATTFDVNNRLKTNRLGIQGGVDYGFAGARIGLTGGYGRAKADNDLNSTLKATGWNIGAYAQFGGPAGFHGSGLVKYDRYKLRFTDGAFDGEGGHLKAFGVDGSLGYRFAMGDTATVDAKLGLSSVSTKVDDISAFGFDYDIGRIKSTRGRAGVRATFGGDLAPYVDATLYHEFDGHRNVTLFDGVNSYDIGTNGKATWGRIEAGISPNGGPGPLLAAWADLGDKRGFGIRAGFRFGGRAEALVAPPPPPPPPPPPAPATQTCADGSVILATDACPALPPPAPEPPPPPPPAPERG